MRARFSKLLIRKLTAVLLQPSSLDQQLLLVNKKVLLIYTLSSHYLIKATPRDNALGTVFYNIFFDALYHFQVF